MCLSQVQREMPVALEAVSRAEIVRHAISCQEANRSRGGTSSVENSFSIRPAHIFKATIVPSLIADVPLLIANFSLREFRTCLKPSNILAVNVAAPSGVIEDTSAALG